MLNEKKTYIDLDVSFILPFLKKIGNRSYEIKLVEFYNYNIKNENTITKFRDYLRDNNVYYKENRFLKYTLKIINLLDQLMFEKLDSDFSKIKFKEWKEISDKKLIAKFELKD